MKEFLRPTKLKFVVLVLLLLFTFLTSFAFMGVFCGIVGPCIQPWYYGHPVLVVLFHALTLPYFLLEGARLHTFLNFGLARDIVQISVLGSGILATLVYQYALACLIHLPFRR